MKVAGLVFSARKRGNGFQCMKYCIDKLKERGFKTMLLNAYDYEIKPCSHCNYECYSGEIRGTREKCPVKDDLPEMYESIKDADWLVFAVPCYGGHTPAIYRAWAERMPHLPEVNDEFKSFEQFQKAFLNKIKGFIIIGNLTSMGDMSLHEVLVDLYCGRTPATILLQANEYGRNSLKGDLIRVPQVREKLDRFVERLRNDNRQKAGRFDLEGESGDLLFWLLSLQLFLRLWR
jgi:multimeric flavodoxin WrbA